MKKDFAIVEEWLELVSAIIAAVTTSVHEVISVIQPEGRKGGYFCLLDHATGTFLIPPTLIGEVTNGEGDKYAEYCAEKARRISILIDADVNHTHSSDPWLSWESRDSDKQRWGGAVGCGLDGRIVIFSFSGLPEMGDEAAMFLTSAKMGVLEKFVRRSAEVSNNTIIKEHLCFIGDGDDVTILEERALDALAKKWDVPRIDLEEEVPDPEVVKLIDLEMMKRLKVLLVRIEDGELIVAMVDPSNLMAIDDIRLVTGYDVQPRICSEKALNAKIQELFPAP